MEPNSSHQTPNQISSEIGNGNSMNDPLWLSNSDHPGAQLVASVFNGSNFLSWSRGVQMALGAKYKIGFIDGSLREEDVAPGDLQRWKRCDYMVRCWLTNSMAPNLAEGFVFTESSRDLWLEIIERYAQSNGPLLYQLRKKLGNTVQGNLTVTEYYGKIKRLWSEILSLEGTVKCTCGAIAKCTCDVKKKLAEIDNRNKLLQFLMGLNDCYDSARNQILASEPLPTIDKAYYLVQQVATGVEGDGKGQTSDASALSVNKAKGERKPSKKDKVDKSSLKVHNTKCNQL